MTGSLFFVVVIIVAGLLLAILASPIFLVPAVVIILVTLFAAPLFARLRTTERPGASSGVPSTREATYDPVSEPDGPTPRGG
jgi:hypothetical protein